MIVERGEPCLTGVFKEIINFSKRPVMKSRKLIPGLLVMKEGGRERKKRSS